MAVVASLDVVLGAITKPFDRGMKKSRSSLNNFSRAFTRVAGLIGAGFSARALFDSANNFQQAMQQSTAIMGDLSDTMKTDMKEAAEQVALSTKFSAAEAAEAYFFLASAGLDAAQSIEALPVAAKFAQAGMFDLSTATDLLTDAQSALGLSVSDAAKNMENMTRVADVLVKANTLANATVEQFSSALTNKAGAALRNLGKDLEEGVAALAVFADQGLKGEAAGTALAIVLRDLQAAAVNNADLWKKYNIELFDGEGNVRNLADVVEQLGAAFERAGNDLDKKLLASQLGFQDKSFGFLQSLLGQEDALRKYEEGLRSAGGTMDEIASKQLTPFQMAMNKLQATFEVFANEAVTPFLDGIGQAEGGLSSFGETLRFVLDTMESITLGVQGVAASVKRLGADVALGSAEIWQGIADVTGSRFAAQQAQDAGATGSDLLRDSNEFFDKLNKSLLEESPGERFSRKLQKDAKRESEKQTKELKDLNKKLGSGVVLGSANL